MHTLSRPIDHPDTRQPDHLDPTQLDPTQFHTLHRPARGRHGLACWLSLPRERAATQPPIVAIHGIQRGAEDIVRAFAARAAAEGRAVIAPVFDEANWQGYQRVVAPRRADLALMALLEELAGAGVGPTRRFTLFGFSGGAQFAHRFALLYPHRIERLVAAAAGWYTMPDATAAFPYGLCDEDDRRTPWGARCSAALGAFLQVPVTVLVGAHDDHPDRSTRSTPALDRQQGPDRLSRARCWVQAVSDAASRRGLPPRVSLEILPACGHDFLACAAHGGLVEHVFDAAGEDAALALAA